MSCLHEFINAHHPAAAARAARVIVEGSTLLADSLDIGRPMNDGTYRRELYLAFGAGAYVLRYIQNKDGNVVIIRVWHSREHRSSTN